MFLVPRPQQKGLSSLGQEQSSWYSSAQLTAEVWPPQPRAAPDLFSSGLFIERLPKC